MFVTLLLSLTLGAGAQAREHHRALWVWKPEAILQSSEKRAEFFKFLDAPKGDAKARITVLFLGCKIPSRVSGSDVSSFLSEAHHRSLRVDYLCGEAKYATTPYYGEGLGELKNVLSYNREASRDSRFNGIQYDVEPYSLPGWPKESILNGYIGFLSKCRSGIDSSGQKLALGAAVPRWFDGADLHGLHKSVLDRVDYVAVMDYVSKPDQFVKDAAQTVQYAAKRHKDAWLGAEVSELPLEKTATFYALGNAKLEETFSAAEKAFATSKGFAGVAVEWYDTYVALKP